MTLVCICGPTATGKTRLGVELALETGGEVVSCDSMQVYRGMDIGTAKATKSEMRGVKHHMLDVAEPGETFSASLYTRMADDCIADIALRQKQPIIVGGTMLYMDSLINGGGFASAPPPGLREKLTALAETPEGRGELMDMLRSCDPESADKLHANDTKRVIRALEVYHATGKTISAHNRGSSAQTAKYEAARIILSYSDRQKLYGRINSRVDAMMAAGMLDEVRELLGRGLGGSTAMQAIGYKELAAHLRGELSLAAAVETVKQESRRYAKRQLTWLRRYGDSLWINVDECEDFDMLKRISTNYLHSRNVIYMNRS